MREILMQFYRMYVPMFYPTWDRDYSEKVIEKLNEDFPSEESLYKEFKHTNVKYYKSGDIEHLMVYRFNQDSVILARHADKIIRLAVIESLKDDWKDVIMNQPFWVDFTRDYNHLTDFFDSHANFALAKHNSTDK